MSQENVESRRGQRMNRNRSKTIAALASSVALTALSPAAFAHRSDSQPSAEQPPHVTLDHGQLLGEPWSTSIFRDTVRQPCFEVDTQTPSTALGGSVCGRPTRKFAPIIALQSGGGPTRGTVVLLVTALNVHRVDLELDHRPDRNVWPKQVSYAKAHRARLRAKFKYKILTLKGGFCLRRHVDYNAHGRVYYRSHRYSPCSEQRKIKWIETRRIREPS